MFNLFVRDPTGTKRSPEFADTCVAAACRTRNELTACSVNEAVRGSHRAGASLVLGHQVFWNMDVQSMLHLSLDGN